METHTAKDAKLSRSVLLGVRVGVGVGLGVYEWGWGLGMGGGGGLSPAHRHHTLTTHFLLERWGSVVSPVLCLC